jgi:hypothetical protein
MIYKCVRNFLPIMYNDKPGLVQMELKKDGTPTRTTPCRNVDRC